ncbi:hypothetical protein JVY00_08555 [Tsukamurella tyrosinosolvens]|uniref:DUF5994 family protein n=1 Tax=Tsukamurella tyrosinosolvens TaxID=57704 RepID=UPI001AF146D0|nr:DUF5994 family protein [Tsukamurella tyrosinosolvens]QRY86088.1 hypothetical protein JVY00_08555 [Tsukamurella tyrosinosolvens]
MTHPHHPDTPPSARFELKAVGSIPGAVDGVWWPRTRDLPNELAQAHALVRARILRVERVCYRYSNWDPAPRKTSIDGNLIRLDGYTTHPLDTIRFVGNGSSLVLALIAPETDTDVAELASVLEMTGAASQSPHDLNLEALRTVNATHQRDAAEQSRDDEGGHPTNAQSTTHRDTPRKSQPHLKVLSNE